VIGASRTAQLVEAVTLINKGPMSAEMVNVAGEIWRAFEKRAAII
jgi:hypothetical protein